MPRPVASCHISSKCVRGISRVSCVVSHESEYRSVLVYWFAGSGGMIEPSAGPPPVSTDVSASNDTSERGL